MRTLAVLPGTGSLRLDVFLCRTVPACSRRTAQRAIASGAVRINGHRARKGQTVGDSDRVEVPDELYEPATLPPNPALSVVVLYADAALIAIDKPAGMPSHALRPGETDTAANFLLARFPELAGVGTHRREPGLVHRLDTDTSGILLAARTQPAFLALRAQFAGHSVRKEYLALVHGDVAVAGKIDTPIAHDRHNRRKMRLATSADPHARPALTRYRPLERLGAGTLVHVEIATGVRHQIRVHLSGLGHPLIGDHLYGSGDAAALAPRHLLHASRITIAHPDSGASLTISSPIPADFAAALERLRHHSSP